MTVTNFKCATFRNGRGTRKRKTETTLLREEILWEFLNDAFSVNNGTGSIITFSVKCVALMSLKCSPKANLALRALPKQIRKHLNRNLSTLLDLN